MDIKKAVGLLVERHNLTFEQMKAVMEQVVDGRASPAQIAAMLVAMRMKGEQVDEICAAVSVLRELATPVSIEADHLVDIVGTGGDGANLFNVSTAASFVAACAGASVAKHGNRGVSSRSGSADLLQEAGVVLDLAPDQIADCVHKLGLGFMFAPHHHQSMKSAAAPRKELGIRTFMNILGPLLNPARVPNLLVGVYTRSLCEPVAHVLHRFGHRHALVVHSDDGLDEISVAAPTSVAELKNGEISSYSVTPESLGVARQNLTGLAVQNSGQSLALIRDALGPQEGEWAAKAAAVIALNAGAAIYVAGCAETLEEGVARAQKIVGSGAALAKIDALVQQTNGYSRP